jgi:tryptophan synthase alpha subunit
MILHKAIEDANASGRLGLILYDIPNFPDPDSYAATMEMLGRTEAVSIVEIAVPVTTGFSGHANETIREAHLLAARHNDLLRSMPRPAKPSLCVLYRETYDDLGFDGVLDEYGRLFDGVLLEWDEPDSRPYLERARKRGMELVQCIGPWHAEEQIKELVGMAEPQALVYLMSAAMTGSKLFPVDELGACIAKAKAFRPDIKVAAGFGIRTAADVKSLHQVEGLDGVIIGTAFLEVAGHGVGRASDYVQEIAGAL